MAQNSSQAYFRLMLIARYQKLATLLQMINDCVKKKKKKKKKKKFMAKVTPVSN